jgi:hypothetical protein
LTVEVEERAEADSTLIRVGSLGRARVWKDILGMVWVLGAAVAVLVPLLARGHSFGEFDYLSQLGVLAQHGVVVHNSQAGDQADSTIPWATLVWTQIHAGHIPLWNPYGALGMPLTFNWQAATFSIPSLITYLFPLSFSSTIQVVLTLFIAGSGAYFLGRILGLGAMASAFAATVFELSGPMMGWLGWIHSSAMAWAGWIFALSILVIRGNHRLRYISLLALAIAAMIYSGSPEILVLLGIAIAVFLVVALLTQFRKFKRDWQWLRAGRDLLIGGVGGAMLSAPLLLPGFQLISVSQRGESGGDPAELLPGNPPLPPHNLIHLLFQGYDGLPIAGNHWFGYVLGYSETAAYVGIIAVVLAIIAVVIKRSSPAVLGFGVMTLAMIAIAFVPFVTWVVSRAPVVGTVIWQRALFPLAFGLAILGGFGLDALTQRSADRKAPQYALFGFATAALVVILLWVFGRGHLPANDASSRSDSFIWPTIQIVIGLVAVGALIASRRRTSLSVKHHASLGKVVGAVLLLVESAFLVAAGGSLWTASPNTFPSTTAELALKQNAGSSLVGFGAPLCFFPPGLGITPNAQLAYGIRELGLYDPMIPNGYFSSWQQQTHTSAGNANDSAYCPAVKTVDEARLYGVGILLEPKGSAGPAGTAYVSSLGNESAYRVPNSGPASLVPIHGSHTEPGLYAKGTQVPVSHPDPAAWKITTDAHQRSLLRLRLTDVPGWHASVDGRAIPLTKFAGVMLQMDIPAGHHVVNLYYWPSAFTHGIVLAVIAVLAFLVAVVVSRRRSGPRRQISEATSAADRL